jgi:peptidoglycan/LPS O-acetylase OafA/YrhL
VRALAVGAVLVYHLGTTGDSTHILKGGYLGVDVFFVLSGYLITSLLIVEARQTGRISIKNSTSDGQSGCSRPCSRCSPSWRSW